MGSKINSRCIETIINQTHNETFHITYTVLALTVVYCKNETSWDEDCLELGLYRNRQIRREIGREKTFQSTV